MHTLSTESALSRIRRRDIQISTVIDIGASDGSWSKMAMNFYPDTIYYLIEAQSNHKKKLELFKLVHNNVMFELAAAGNYNGTVQFDNSDAFGGVVLEIPTENSIDVPMKTIDSIVESANLKAPYLLKLDTHGYEKSNFEGAVKTLKNTNLLVVETYNFNIAKDSIRFPSMCNYLEEQGFGPIDISEPIFRPNDNTLWQFDLFSIKSNSKYLKTINMIK